MAILMLMLVGLAVMALVMWVLGQSPLARAIGRSMACFAEAARGEPDALR